MQKYDITIDELKDMYEKYVKYKRGYCRTYDFLKFHQFSYFLFASDNDDYGPYRMIERENYFIYIKNGIVVLPTSGSYFFFGNPADGIRYIEKNDLDTLKKKKDYYQKRIEKYEKFLENTKLNLLLKRDEKNGYDLKPNILLIKLKKKKLNEIIDPFYYEEIFEEETKDEKTFVVHLKDGFHLFEEGNKKLRLTRIKKDFKNQLKWKEKDIKKLNQIEKRELEKIEFILNKNKIKALFM